MELFFALIVFCWIVCGLCWLFVKVGELLFGKFWERGILIDASEPMKEGALEEFKQDIIKAGGKVVKGESRKEVVKILLSEIRKNEKRMDAKNKSGREEG